MSLDDKKRAVVVGLEMSKAYEALSDAVLLGDNSRWSGAAGRLYYAVFHAVSALLVHDAHEVKSHKGAGVLFHQYYVKTNKVPAVYGALFGRLEDMREEGDYNCHYTISADEFTTSLPAAKEMVDAIAAMVGVGEEKQR